MDEHGARVSVEGEPGRWCRGCGYNLRGLPTPRCPECGRGFDPADPHTYRVRPPGQWLRHVKRAATTLAALLLLAGAVWCWFFWGWYSEQQVLGALRVAPSDPVRVRSAPLLGSWTREHLGRAGCVLDRVTYLDLSGRTDIVSFMPLAELTRLRGLNFRATRIADLVPLAALTRLEGLQLADNPITDLAPLAGLTTLQMLSLDNTRVTDLAPLAGLTKLQMLNVDDVPSIRDLRPLAGLRELRQLRFREAPITDLTPLAGLTKMQNLYLQGTRVEDLTPLVGMKDLYLLRVGLTKAAGTQAAALQRALPACDIIRTE